MIYPTTAPTDAEHARAHREEVLPPSIEDIYEPHPETTVEDEDDDRAGRGTGGDGTAVEEEDHEGHLKTQDVTTFYYYDIIIIPFFTSKKAIFAIVHVTRIHYGIEKDGFSPLLGIFIDGHFLALQWHF